MKAPWLQSGASPAGDRPTSSWQCVRRTPSHRRCSWKSRRHKVLLFLTSSLFACNSSTLPGDLATRQAACPATLDAISAFGFGLGDELETKLKAGLSGAVYLRQAAARLEASVAMACANIAADLDADIQTLPAYDGSGKASREACTLAAAALTRLQSDLSAKLFVESRPPVCESSLDNFTQCATECDPTLTPATVDAVCASGKLTGQCNGECHGECTVRGNVACKGYCTGTCEGACSSNFSGRCEGACKGTCDGKSAYGPCDGTCIGECTAHAAGRCGGTCEGQCLGACAASTTGTCDGPCSGKCSGKLKDANCSEQIQSKRLNAECKAKCDAKATTDLDCKTPQVNIHLESDQAPAQLDALRATLTANLATLLSVGSDVVSSSAEAAADAVRSTLSTLRTAAKARKNHLQADACLAAALTTETEAIASIRTSVSAATSVSGRLSPLPSAHSSE